MDNIISLLLNNVNIEAYAKSENFIGYYESKEPLQNFQDTVAPFLNAFLDSPSDWTLVCTLVMNDLKQDCFNESERESLEKLTLCGWIKNTDEVDEENLEAHFTGFSMKKEDESDLVSLCQLIFSNNLFGHAFLINKKRSLIMYPHDDGGFGAVGCNRTSSYDHGAKILSAIDKNKGFNLSLKKKR